MTAKEFFKRFRWGAFVPAALYFVIGVMTAAIYPATTGGTTWPAYEFTVAALALLAGACAVAYYFLGQDDILALLSGVGAISVAIYLFVPPLAKRSVVPIALGISLILHAAAMFYGGLRVRKEKLAECVARIVFGTAFAVLGVLSCVGLFGAADNWLFAGVCYLACAAFMFLFALFGGLFEEEEILKFRPVKKPESAEKEESGDEEEAEEPDREETKTTPWRGAHRR